MESGMVGGGGRRVGGEECRVVKIFLTIRYPKQGQTSSDALHIHLFIFSKYLFGKLISQLVQQGS